jgi:hypothetical protein
VTRIFWNASAGTLKHRLVDGEHKLCIPCGCPGQIQLTLSGIANPLSGCTNCSIFNKTYLLDRDGPGGGGFLACTPAFLPLCLDSSCRFSIEVPFCNEASEETVIFEAWLCRVADVTAPGPQWAVVFNMHAPHIDDDGEGIYWQTAVPRTGDYETFTADLGFPECAATNGFFCDVTGIEIHLEFP